MNNNVIRSGFELDNGTFGVSANTHQKKYQIIYADPPWSYNDKMSGHSFSLDHEYETQSKNWIANLPIKEISEKDCVLFLWAVSPQLPEAIEVMKAWGFKYKTCAFSWMKANPYKLFAMEEDIYMGFGYWTRANSEVCLLATRGKPKRLNADVRQGIIEPRREHSRKPDCVHERIERLVAGPYLELFARQTKPGWTCWGNEVGKFDA